MSSILPAAIRGGIQTMWGGLAAWLATTLGITLTEDQSTTVVIGLTGVVTGLVIAGIRWLETRQGDGWQRWARKAAALLMLGMSGTQPTYSKPAPPPPANGVPDVLPGITVDPKR